MKAKRIIAAALAATMTLGQLLAVAPSAAAVSADELPGANLTANDEGLWITEIYSNDVNRSKQNGALYEQIQVFGSSEDLMEFVELYSTYEATINLSDYKFFYGETEITVTDMNGNSNIDIVPGQPVVLWNYRSDLGESILPTEQQFKEEMNVDEDALVLKAVTGGNGNGWAANNYAFSIRDKNGVTVSSFTCPAGTDVYTLDGFSVELKVADLGSDMMVYREKTAPSAGKVYSAQLNGLVTTQVPDTTYAEGVYITEVRPNDTDRTAAYTVSGETTGDDLMECFEIVNTTNEDVNLNEEYNFKYFLTAAKRLSFDLYHYDETAEKGIGSSEECVIPAGGTAVIWNYRINTLTNIDKFASFPTEADFRAAYNIPDDVPVYLWINQNGLGNTNRGIELYKADEDGSEKLASQYIWVGSTDCKDNKSAILSVNPEGPEMLLSSANATSTIGTVAESQYTYLHDDGSALELRLAVQSDTFAQEDSVVPASVMQGEEIRVDFYYAVTGDLPRTGLATYYRFYDDGEWGEWNKSVEGGTRIPNLYEAIISADELFDHDFVQFYVSASNAYRSTLSDVYTVQINKLNDVETVRTNISDGEEVRGTVTITANDGGDNAETKIYVDGEEKTTTPVLEDGAYFSFYADGRDSYFKNAITTTENEWITAIGKWQYAISNGQAHHIDNSYFTYNETNDSYDVTLRFWAGTYGTTVDEYLYPNANREDFKVSQLQLKLANGKTYQPTKIGPAEFEGVDTSAKTNLSTAYDAVHSIGDSANMCPYMDVTFSVPASEVTAVGAEIDTTQMSEGEHTLKVTSGESITEVRFVVDNTAPTVALGITENEVLSGNITLNPTVEGASTVIYALDGEHIQVPYTTTAFALGEGEHTLSVLAEDAAGNQTTDAVIFNVSNAAINLDDAGTTDITDTAAKLYLSAQNATNATFYEAEKINIAQIATNTVSGTTPYIRYTIDVGNVSDDAVIVTSWNGEASGSDDTHASTMYVEDPNTGKWVKLARADENGSIESAQFSAKDYVKNGVATIIVQCTADSALPDLDSATNGTATETWDGTNVPEDYDFSFAWITDTQYYAEQYMWHFTGMNDYIVNKADELKIKYVIHTGDIVDDWDMIYEWENADKAMSILDEAGMPYGVLGGNHDVAAGLEDNGNYYTYFGEDRFEDQPTYGGSYENNLGHYDLISQDGQDFIIVYMSWNIYQEEIDWMNEVLAQYSDRKAILCFHPYTNVKASDDGLLDYYGVLIQKEVVKKNPNVFAVLNGHYHGSSYQTVTFDDDDDGVNERTVYQICTDYQSAFEGGTGYIKFLYFDLDGDKVYINSYSPTIDDDGDWNYYDGTGVDNLNQLAQADEDGVVYKTGIDTVILEVDFDTEEQSILTDSFSAYVCTDDVLGTTDVTDGTAELELIDLDADTEYAWYAVLTNGNTGSMETGVYEFTTEIAGENVVMDLINAIGTVTLDSKDAIEAAREAYDALSSEQKDLVENYETLEAAEDALDALTQANAEAANESNEAAQEAMKSAMEAAKAAKAAADEAKAAAEAAAAVNAQDKTAAEEAAKMAEEAQAKAGAAYAASELAQTAAIQAQAAAEAADADGAAKFAAEAQAAAEDAEVASEAAQAAAEVAKAYQIAQESQADKASAEAAAAEAKLALAKYNALNELDKFIAGLDITCEVEKELIAEIVEEAKDAINYAADEEKIAAVLEEGKATAAAVQCPSDKFADVAEDGWYHKGVDYMVSNGYMKGISDTEFGVNSNLTRAQLVTILYRIEGEPEVAGMNNPFNDVQSGEYYTNAVIWAANAGVVKGIDDVSFVPDGEITREQLVTMLFRYAEAEAEGKNHLAAYSDENQVSKYAVDAMNWAVANGVVNGVTKNTLAPASTAKRSEICTMLMRFLQN